jgi:hypothetical protein|tara:strand:- start:5329 stop:5721 length:393 start_codon:yes stop_codon:yes gene_type:complete
MEKKIYTLKLEITSSSFPNHPHLAVAVAKKMWSLGHDTQSISNQIGTPMKIIQQIARLEGWKRERRNTLEGCNNFWGPFLTTEESLQLPESDFSGTDDPEAVQPETNFRNKYVEFRSASSTLAWIGEAYK